MINQTDTTNSSVVTNTDTKLMSQDVSKATTPVTDKPATITGQSDTSNAQTTNQSGSEEQVTPNVPATVKLELSAEQADMIQTLLSDYVLAYRSDRSVDYKPEPVPREKVGQYPYVATPPAPEIINPAYDWINHKWYSKNASDSLPDLANTVADLKDAQLTNAQQSLALTQFLQKITESQSNSDKLMASIQEILIGIKATQDQKSAAPTESQTNQQSVQGKNENGGN